MDDSQCSRRPDQGNARHQTPGAPTPPAGPVYVSTRSRARFVYVAAAVAIVLNVVSLWAGIDRADVERQVLLGLAPQADVRAVDVRQWVLLAATISVLLVMLVAYLMWIYRSYKNLPALGVFRRRMGPAGAVWWHFCPIANYWKPCQAMLDIARSAARGRRIKAMRRLSLVWWIVLVVSREANVVFLKIGVARSRLPMTPEVYRQEVELAVVSTLIPVISLVLTIITIAKMTAGQEAEHRLRQS